MDEEKADQILDAVKISMGMDINDSDALQIKKWAERVTELMTFRETLSEFLKERMSAVAPNLQALIGEIVGSKLIAHAERVRERARGGGKDWMSRFAECERDEEHEEDEEEEDPFSFT